MTDALRHNRLWPDESTPGRLEVAPGAVWLRGHLSLEEQRTLLEQSVAYLDGPSGGYVPVVRGGGQMHVRMMCLGRHWNACTYTYGATRSDFDDLPVPPVPVEWRTLAMDAARCAGFTFSPDVCIINHYSHDGRMGLHQDKDESVESIRAGAPVVSLSVGDTARFLFGGLTRRQRPEALMLASGDVFVFGGPARLTYHGVSRIVSQSGPPSLALTGRINLTFRQY
jgi:DNA alkylation damage repair protein AlkB